jgi:hypothetical protein
MVICGSLVMAEVAAQLRQLDVFLSMDPEMLEICRCYKVNHLLLCHSREDVMGLLKGHFGVWIHIGQVLVCSLEDPIRCFSICKEAKILVMAGVLDYRSPLRCFVPPPYMISRLGFHALPCGIKPILCLLGHLELGDSPSPVRVYRLP